MADERDDTLDGLNLEAGLEAAFDEPAQSVIAQLTRDGRKLRPVLLQDPDSSLGPVVRAAAHGRAGRYQIAGEIARGGVGVVLKGHDVDLGRDVAMKVIRDEHAETPEVVQRFVEEAQIGGQLQHPGIVPVYEIGLGRDKRPFFTMKLVKGKTLSAYLAARKSVRQGRSRFLSIFESICQTMAYAHARGVIHRDLKPSNIMIGAYGEVLVVDWGMGKVLRRGGVDDERAARRKSAEETVVATLRSEAEGSQSVVGSVMGTPRYMAPEQARGDIEHVDERSDVFGLGAILCEILTGKPPYTGEDHEVFTQAAMARLDDAYARLDACGADKQLIAIARQCLAPAPAARYENAHGIAKAIAHHLSGLEQRAEKAKLAAARAEERAASERKAAKAAKRIARKEKEAATQAQRARRLTLALAGVVVLVIAAGAGLWIERGNARERERKETAQAVAAHLKEAEQLLRAGNLDGAGEAVARARERDPDAAAPLAVRAKIDQAREDEARRRDADAADDARREARTHLLAFADAQRAIRELAARVEEERKAVYLAHAPESSKAAFAQREQQLEHETLRRQAILADAREAGERARRLEEKRGEASKATMSLLTEVFVEQWRLARAEGEEALATVYHAAAMKHDAAGAYRKELLGHGTLTVNVEARGAEVHLFRYEPLQSMRNEAVVPRLVPVGTSGIGRVEIEGYSPGTVCSVVETVAKDSPAHKAGLRAGDLVLSINGLPADHSMVIVGVVSGSPAERGGIRPWTRVRKANGIEAFHWLIAHLHWRVSKHNKRPKSVETRDGRVETGAGELLGIRHNPMASLFIMKNAPPLRFHCLRDGAVIDFTVPANTASGIEARVTAYPLALAPGCRLPVGRAATVEPGSYLVHVRAPGREAQRYPVLVSRNGEVTVNLRLHPDGTSPTGFVYVPAGPFLFGDPEAFRGIPRTPQQLDGFWIQRSPVTMRDYLEFLNDPETLKHVDSSGELFERVPRESAGERDKFRHLLTRAEDGTFKLRGWLLDVTPVLGVDVLDARAYVAWRNKRAEATGEPWVYDLPTDEQWEKAAAGADGRPFPWGHRDDFSLSVNFLKSTKPLFWVPGGAEPRDASPYDITDIGGCRWELVHSKDRYAVGRNSSVRGFLNKGGSWNGRAGRIGGRGFTIQAYDGAGFRLVARRR